jgi:riboflavin kinase, archaea type
MVHRGRAAEALMRDSYKYPRVAPGAKRGAAKRPPPTGPVDIALLKALAEAGAARAHVPLSSGELAAQLEVSQQTASRRVLALLAKGLVERRMGARRPQLRLTAQGIAALRRELASLQAALDPSEAPARTLAFAGRISTGLGEGRYYMSRRGYRDAIARLLEFEPFPGTLNVSLEGAEAAKLTDLGAHRGLHVAPFTDEGRSFGAVKCFRATVRGVDAGVVMPERGHHRDVLEVVAPGALREKLGLRDGDAVTVEVTVE